MLQRQQQLGETGASSPLPTHGFSRTDDVLSSTVADDDGSFHTCQHSPTLLDDTSEAPQMESMQQLSLQQRRQLPYSPSPILAVVDNIDAVTDTDDLEMFGK